MKKRSTLPLRFTALVGGLALYGAAIALIYRAAVGVSPWDVLAQGLSLRTGINYGLMTNLIGAVVLLLWWPLRQRPGVGTVLNVLLVGTCAQLVLNVFPPVDSLWIRVPLFVAGVLLLAIASGLYISPKLGPGPRDGLMTGLNQRFGIPIWAARNGVEILVALIGWLLGGNLGVGTVVFALVIGPLCQFTLPWFAARVPGRPASGAGSETEPRVGSGSEVGPGAASGSASGSGKRAALAATDLAPSAEPR